MQRPYPFSVLLVLSPVIYYGTGYATAILCVLSTKLVWGQYNFFGYIMPFYPMLAGLLIGRTIGKHRKSRVGFFLSLVIPLLLTYLEAKYFHAAFLKVILHPVPHFKVAIHHYIFYPLLLAFSLWGYRIGLKRY